MDFILQYRDEAQHAFSIALALAAWRWGGNPERIVAIVFVVLFTLPNRMIPLFTGSAFLFVEGGMFYAAVDVIAAIAFTAVALNANRNYTLWIAGFQLVAASAHGVRYVTDAVTDLAHAVMVIGPSYFQLMIMTVGLIRHIKRKNRYGEYRDWRISHSDIDFSTLARKRTDP
ncbi:MAG: hypothetical protein QNJ15_04745 [Erythrobacter sp.]|nr:hypothetical protein [Erythrobacter sp.]